MTITNLKPLRPLFALFVFSILLSAVSALMNPNAIAQTQTPVTSVVATHDISGLLPYITLITQIFIIAVGYASMKAMTTSNQKTLEAHTRDIERLKDEATTSRTVQGAHQAQQDTNVRHIERLSDQVAELSKTLAVVERSCQIQHGNKKPSLNG